MILQWPEFVFAGVSYALEHLNASTRQLIIAPNPRAPERCILLSISYGLHGFSRAIRDGEIEPNGLISDGREQRVFDPERYRLSLELPRVLATLELRRCFHTGHRNFFTVEILDAQGIKHDYVVYFRTWRAASPESGDVRVHLESAYLRSDVPHKSKKSIRFKVIAANTYTGREIHEPRN